VCQRYANALIKQAEKEKSLDRVERDMHELRAMIKSSGELRSVIRSPLFNGDTLTKAMFALADKAKFQNVTKKFLGVLIVNSRLDALEKTIAEFEKALSVRRGEVNVDVKVAQDLSAKQKKDLEVALSKSLGRDVAVKVDVVPEILGGMVVTIGSRMIDNSVARKLSRLRSAMGAQANDSQAA